MLHPRISATDISQVIQQHRDGSLAMRLSPLCATPLQAILLHVDIAVAWLVARIPRPTRATYPHGVLLASRTSLHLASETAWRILIYSVCAGQPS